MKLSDAVTRVIALADTIREYWETELPKRHPNYPIANPGAEPVPPPPEEKKLAKFFASLPEESVYQIALVMDLGRGYFGVGEIADHFHELKENYDNATALASLMTNKASLAAYLEDGLAELKKHAINVDKLPLKTAKTRR